jgi:hypothetical protein
MAYTIHRLSAADKGPLSIGARHARGFIEWGDYNQLSMQITIPRNQNGLSGIITSQVVTWSEDVY